MPEKARFGGPFLLLNRHEARCILHGHSARRTAEKISAKNGRLTPCPAEPSGEAASWQQMATSVPQTRFWRVDDTRP